jgi:hypothetical protein
MKNSVTLHDDVKHYLNFDLCIGSQWLSGVKDNDHNVSYKFQLLDIMKQELRQSKNGQSKRSSAPEKSVRSITLFGEQQLSNSKVHDQRRETAKSRDHLQ